MSSINKEMKEQSKEICTVSVFLESYGGYLSDKVHFFNIANNLNCTSKGS